MTNATAGKHDAKTSITGRRDTIWLISGVAGIVVTILLTVLAFGTWSNARSEHATSAASLVALEQRSDRDHAAALDGEIFVDGYLDAARDLATVSSEMAEYLFDRAALDDRRVDAVIGVSADEYNALIDELDTTEEEIGSRSTRIRDLIIEMARISELESVSGAD